MQDRGVEDSDAWHKWMMVVCGSVRLGCITSSDGWCEFGGMERLWKWEGKMARILDEERIARI